MEAQSSLRILFNQVLPRKEKQGERSKEVEEVSKKESDYDSHAV